MRNTYYVLRITLKGNNMPIHCDIVTQERLVYSKEVDIVLLPGVEGQMGILPNHTSLLTALTFGEVITRAAGVEEYFAIGGGFAEVQPDRVIVLADSAESAVEIDVDRAQAARDRAEKAMREGEKLDPDQYEHIERELRKAQLRIDVSRRRGNKRMTGMGQREQE
jgi:F-type H+-transporting ATPase subunit epsilon